MAGARGPADVHGMSDGGHRIVVKHVAPRVAASTVQGGNYEGLEHDRRLRAAGAG